MVVCVLLSREAIRRIDSIVKTNTGSSRGCKGHQGLYTNIGQKREAGARPLPGSDKPASRYHDNSFVGSSFGKMILLVASLMGWHPTTVHENVVVRIFLSCFHMHFCLFVLWKVADFDFEVCVFVPWSEEMVLNWFQLVLVVQIND